MKAVKETDLNSVVIDQCGDFDRTAHPRSCINCSQCWYFSPEYGEGGSAGWACDGRNGAQNLKSFPFRTEQKCFVSSICWVDRRRNKIPLNKMDTPYLYNVIKMIWNNHLAPNHPFGDVIHWNFIQPVHTPEFLNRFFEVGLGELKSRHDNKVAKDFILHVEHFYKNNIKIKDKQYFSIKELIDDIKDFPLND